MQERKNEWNKRRREKKRNQLTAKHIVYERKSVAIYMMITDRENGTMR